MFVVEMSSFMSEQNFPLTRAQHTEQPIRNNNTPRLPGSRKRNWFFRVQYLKTLPLGPGNRPSTVPDHPRDPHQHGRKQHRGDRSLNDTDLMMKRNHWTPLDQSKEKRRASEEPD